MRKRKQQKIIIERVKADPDFGLTEKQVDERVSGGFVNIAADPTEKSTAKIVMDNLFTFFNAVLFSIALVFIGFIIYLSSIGRSDVVNTYFGFSKFFFLVIALLNFGIGTVQEIKSLKVIKKLKIITETKSRVVREGKLMTLDAKRIVLDDIVAVKAGEQATADMIVISGEISVDESMLTGESDLVKKSPGDTVYSGSFVIVGDARCRADAVGDDTYAAKLSKKVKSVARHQSELMSSIMHIIKILTLVLVVVVSAVTVTMALKIAKHGGEPELWNDMKFSIEDPTSWGLIAVTGGSFGIGVIPSGLVLTTSVTMLLSIAQLAKKQTLIQELYSLENLSRIDVICLDKTGTLTDGTMEVVDVKAFLPMDDVERYARDLIAASGERNATAEAVFAKFGINENAVYKEKIPFSSANKYSGLIYNDGKKLLMGAPEYLLPKDDKRLEYASARAKEGMRVIAITLDSELAAFIVIADHIRETAPDTLKFFRENGVTVKVISGDSPLTVSKIAEKCGIKNADRYISLEGVPLEQIPEYAEDYVVFTRVSPEQKEALVMALQANGHKVGMTGDGVNDILALRRSDSSITFAKATDAAKSCSDVVLLDNDFSHLKDVVGEGRRVIGNIQRTAVLYLMKSVAVAILAFALIPFAKGQMWFSIENMYMLEAAVIATGGFMLSLEPRRDPVKGSFLRRIRMQAIAAGMLGAAAVLLPIMLNTMPKYLGFVPFITDFNVKPMMTVLLTFSGFVVMFAMCIPFNRYRTVSLTVLLIVACFFGALIPASYIGGQTIGKNMFKFNKTAGRNVFDSPFFNEMFRPWRSPVVRSLFSDLNNFFLLRIFLYFAIPSFTLAMFAAERYANKVRNRVKTANLLFSVGRRLLLVSGLVLLLRSAFSFIELLFSGRHVVVFSGSAGGDSTVKTVFSLIYIFMYIFICHFGYKLWKTPNEKNVKTAFIMGTTLFLLTAAGIILNGGVLSHGDPVTTIDEVMLLIISSCYVTGSVLCMADYKRVLPRS